MGTTTTGNTKICTKCHKTLSLEMFGNYLNKGKQQISSRCKPCCTEAAAKWNKENIDRRISIRKKHYAANRDQMLRNRLKRSAKTLGLDVDTILKHFDTHNGLCDICGEPPTERFTRLAIDHDHVTGKFRGLLCQKCNMGIGYFRDNKAVLEKAIAYLDNYDG